jgi:spore coat polysaccharide biosynthesis protein SpsF
MRPAAKGYLSRRVKKFSRMRIGAIIQARMSSRRLPGKVLLKVGGKPLLQYLLERLGHCRRLDGVLVATSVEKSDTPVWDFCRDHGVPAVRGPLGDVAGRFLQALASRPWDAFVRVSADSPLLDQQLVDEGVRLFGEGHPDLVTNVNPRTFPSGQSVEVVRSETFRLTYPLMVTPEDREHVTPYFYRNSSRFVIRNFTSETYLGDLHLGVDTEEDLEVTRRILEQMERPHWEYPLEELVRMRRSLQGP